jgi:hypothetical protein
MNRSGRGSEASTGAQVHAKAERSEGLALNRSGRGILANTGAQVHAKAERSEGFALKPTPVGGIGVARGPIVCVGGTHWPRWPIIASSPEPASATGTIVQGERGGGLDDPAGGVAPLVAALPAGAGRGGGFT